VTLRPLDEGVFVVDGFATAAECRALVELSRPRLHPSTCFVADASGLAAELATDGRAI
jgi:hypothetical protein